MASCCGARTAQMDYEVTFKDGSTVTVGSIAAAKIELAKDTSVGRPAGSMKAVPRKTA